VNGTSRRPKLFLDTIALFAGIWSPEGGGRLLLRLGEAGAIEILIGAQVLAELDGALRKKAPNVLPLAAALIDRTRAAVVAQPDDGHLRLASSLVAHPADARVLAAAWQAGAEFFVTLDRRHFLRKPDLADRIPFPIGTPGDAVAWIRSYLRRLTE
jgi:predicted nucleic acid-binding protein